VRGRDVPCLSHRSSRRLHTRVYVQTRAGRDGTTGETITHGDGSPAARARQRPRLTWMARPAWACSRRCRYSLVRFHPVMAVVI
jgi:hypothetical protein